EQQADFFVALGQEDAAVDLLTSHIRVAGMMSPLPYAKLLELHQRLDEPEAYERVRERFQRRFNAAAPDWESGPDSGRTLDAYADAVTRLQVVWKAPADAMVLLQSLLFRRDAADELFDLPAYRDVLLLFSVARDLTQHPGAEVPELVDVFLPIGDVASAVSAAAADTVHAGRDDMRGHASTIPPTTFEMSEFDPGTRTTAFGEVDATLDLSPLDFDVTGSDDAAIGSVDPGPEGKDTSGRS
ncbi:MAG TPA: hypothetical protein VH328_07970, partial [Burkholderiaceae bacterium]|nr:hypothetical protein [Burkholderiaceae bacterium]